MFAVCLIGYTRRTGWNRLQRKKVNRTASLCSELVAKMAKDIGMTIRKGIVVPFLPCLVAFWGFHLYMFFHFLKCFFVTLDYSIVRIRVRFVGMYTLRLGV